MDIPQLPLVSENHVKLMLENNYGLTVSSMRPLNGYYDRNYHVEVDIQHRNPHLDNVCDEGYLVKIVNHLDSHMSDFQTGQKLVMDHLNDSGIPCQREIKTVTGQFFSTLTVDKDGENTTYVVSVRSFLRGDVLNKEVLTPRLAYDVGSMCAGICQGLKNLDFKFYDDYSHLWTMDNCLKAKEVMHVITEPARRQVVEEVFKAFESNVIPRMIDFRKGMIHGGVSEQNILVEKSTSGLQICGLIDFQHSCRSFCVFDLSIAIAYLMMVSKTRVPILDVGGHMLAGYEKNTAQMNDAERDALKTLIASRMVMGLVYGAYFYSLDPSNEYYLTTSYVGWKSLFELWKTEETVIWKRWNEIIKSYTVHSGYVDIA